MINVCILDYGSGNVGSVYNLINYLNVNVKVTNNKKDIINSSHVILPGVGSFGTSIMKIKNKIPLDILENEINIKNKPFLGICVGMQVLANYGYEHGKYEGLGWIDGTVVELNSMGYSLPHIGWNNINIKKNDLIIEELDDNNDFYYLNSYIFKPKYNDNIIAMTEYGEQFVSIIKKTNIYGVQFHPEKSQKAGIKLINNFLNI